MRHSVHAAAEFSCAASECTSAGRGFECGRARGGLTDANRQATRCGARIGQAPSRPEQFSLSNDSLWAGIPALSPRADSPSVGTDVWPSRAAAFNGRLAFIRPGACDRGPSYVLCRTRAAAGLRFVLGSAHGAAPPTVDEWRACMLAGNDRCRSSDEGSCSGARAYAGGRKGSRFASRADYRSATAPAVQWG